MDRHLKLLPSLDLSNESIAPIDAKTFTEDYFRILEHIDQLSTDHETEQAIERAIIYLSNAYPLKNYIINGTGILYGYSSNAIMGSNKFVVPGYQLTGGYGLNYVTTAPYCTLATVGLAISPSRITLVNFGQPMENIEFSKAVFVPDTLQLQETPSIDIVTNQDRELLELLANSNIGLNDLIKSAKFLTAGYFTQKDLLINYTDSILRKILNKNKSTNHPMFSITASSLNIAESNQSIADANENDLIVAGYVIRITSHLLNRLIMHPDFRIIKPEPDELIDELIIEVQSTERLMTDTLHQPKRLHLINPGQKTHFIEPENNVVYSVYLSKVKKIQIS